MRRSLAFLTPLGRASVPSPAALNWFPIVGAGLGLALGAVWWASDRLWPRLVAAALVVAADLALTGLLHLDGLVDAADGLLPPMDRQRRLQVMTSPDVGAFGVGTAVSVLLLRWAALSGQTSSPALLGGLWCASRTAMAVTVTSCPYARPGGLATAFLTEPARHRWALAAGGLGLAAVLAGVGRGWPGLAAVAAVLVAGAAVVALARRRVGGFTGDVLGAAGMVGETAGLVVAAARW